MVKLKRLKINKFRNIEPGTELHFSDTYNIILGKNATGKTTLLDLIARVFSGDWRDLEKEEFSIEFDVESNQTTSNFVFSQVATKREPNPRFQVPRFENMASFRTTRNEDKNGWINVEIKNGIMFASDGESREVKEIPHLNSPFSNSIMIYFFGRPLIDWMAETSFRDKLIEEGLSDLLDYPQMKRMDEANGTYELMISNEFNLSSDEIIDESENVPKGVMEQISLKVKKDEGITQARISSKHIPFLDSAVKEFGFSEGGLSLNLAERKATDGVTHFRFNGVRFDFTREDNSLVNQEWLSHGQKRLLAFYFWLASYKDIVVADELVNGLHHGWIESCVEAIKERQSFLSSQNPLLMDYLSFDSAEQVQKSFITCTKISSDGLERLTWKNMSTEDAQAFFEAYNVGIQQVSEILAWRGLF